MSKLILYSLFAIFLFCCKSKENTSSKKYEGLITDPKIKDKVRSNATGMKELGGGQLSFGVITIKAYENDKLIDLPFRTGNKIPCYVVSTYKGDTLSIFFAPIMGGSFGFAIEKYKDSCKVYHSFSRHEATTGPYKLHANDSLTGPGLTVPCKFTVILNRHDYKHNETVYGFVEGRSDDYYIKKDPADIKARVEFKSYFKAVQL